MTTLDWIAVALVIAALVVIFIALYEQGRQLLAWAVLLLAIAELIVKLEAVT